LRNLIHAGRSIINNFGIKKNFRLIPSRQVIELKIEIY